MATLMVDTDVYSYLTSSNPNRGLPYRPHLQGHTVALSFITVGEQYAGYLKMIYTGKWERSRLAKLEAGLRLVLVIPYDFEVCKTFGDLKATLKNPDGSSRAIATNDLWIAACAKYYSLTLVTNNRKDFQGVPGLNIISEAPGPKIK
jgi:predicted nucleic acid-binding protein